MTTSVFAVPDRGHATFVYNRDDCFGTGDPGLLGWFVGDNGYWTVALVIGGQLVFVRGSATRGGPFPDPPEST